MADPAQFPKPPVAAQDCANMADVRAGIDALDRALVALLAERQGFIEAAARIKSARDTVRDQARIDDVLTKVKAEAERLGLSPAIAEAVWRQLIEASIAHEYIHFDSRQSAGNRPAD
jgi:isochorismate pyruvate lyase